MTPLILSFIVDLKHKKFPQADGPIFYRWYPKGETDQIILKDSNEILLKVWFQCAKYLYGLPQATNSNNDDQPMYGGKLFGKLKIHEISTETQQKLLLSVNGGNSNYEDFAKDIIKRNLYPHVSKFLKILHDNYGQFWIQELEEWDSRQSTLYDYCFKLQMKWSFDERNWYEFRPSREVATRFMMEYSLGSQFEQFLLKKDIEDILNLVRNNYAPLLSSELLSEAHMLEDIDEIKNSYIISVSALERLFYELMGSKMKPFVKYLNQFVESSNTTKLIVVSTLLGIPTDDLINSIKAIDIRNKVIHDGVLEDVNHYEILHALFRTLSVISKVLGGYGLKFPPLQRRFRQSLRLT